MGGFYGTSRVAARIRDIVVACRRIPRLEQTPVSARQPSMLDLRASSADAGDSRAR